MKSQKNIFLEKSVLGQKTKLNNPEEVICKCIRLAYSDMLTAGRYYISNDMDTRCFKIYSLLKENNYTFSRKLIDKICPIFGDKEKIGSGNKYATRYGLSQKVLNMTYKYLYVFSDYTNKEIDFSDCDCPLDSVILKKLKLTNYVWSKLTESEYEICQNIIADKIKNQSLDNELMQIGNLAFDFLNW